MPEYIEREQLIKSIQSVKMVDVIPNCDEPYIKEAVYKQGQAIKKIIEKQPTADVVEVVRCKDCKHSCLYCGSYRCENSQTPWFNDEFNIDVGANDYCSYGELKECEGK